MRFKNRIRFESENGLGVFILNPPSTHVIQEGDTLVALGEPYNIKKLHELIPE
jgi:K+/H+ antiporter YhaU regulatory subunit KhtT